MKLKFIQIFINNLKLIKNRTIILLLYQTLFENFEYFLNFEPFQNSELKDIENLRKLKSLENLEDA